MQPEILHQLRDEGFVNEQFVANAAAFKRNRPVPLYWDLQTLLYAGILLFTTGLGIFVYKNIDAIGHVTIIILTGMCCIACFAWCFKKGGGFSYSKLQPPNVWFSYVLLLGCLLLLTFTGYLQVRFGIFGERWGLALFVPMVLLFLAAYYFDNLGVLSLAITNLAAWAGISVTLMQLLTANNFGNERIIYTGVILGAGLMLFSLLTTERNIKQHFAFAYKNFGAHIMLVSCIAGMFLFNSIYLLWFVILLLPCTYLFFTALKEGLLYFVVVSMLYAWVGFSYIITRALLLISIQTEAIYLLLIYYIGSAIGVIRALMYYNKTLKKDDSL